MASAQALPPGTPPLPACPTGVHPDVWLYLHVWAHTAHKPIKEVIQRWDKKKFDSFFDEPMDAVQFDDFTWGWMRDGEDIPTNGYWEEDFLVDTIPGDHLAMVILGKFGDPDWELSKREAAPDDNDGRIECWWCNTIVRQAGGGMYQICDNKKCDHYGS